LPAQSGSVGHLSELESGALFIGFAYQGKDVVFRFIIEYSSLKDLGPYVIIIGLFLYEVI
jgi:hypothetical protein